MSQIKQYIVAPNVDRPMGHYSHAVKWGKLVFVAGQGGFDERGNLVGKDDAVAQAEQVFKNIDSVLQAAGGSFRDVVMLNTYYKSQEVREKVIGAKLRQKYMGDHRPATCGVMVDFAFPGMLVEISAIAAIDEQ